MYILLLKEGGATRYKTKINLEQVTTLLVPWPIQH